MDKQYITDNFYKKSLCDIADTLGEKWYDVFLVAKDCGLYSYFQKDNDKLRQDIASDFINGLTVEKIAELRNIPEGAVRNILYMEKVLSVKVPWLDSEKKMLRDCYEIGVSIEDMQLIFLPKTKDSINKAASRLGICRNRIPNLSQETKDYVVANYEKKPLPEIHKEILKKKMSECSYETLYTFLYNYKREHNLITVNKPEPFTDKDYEFILKMEQNHLLSDIYREYYKDKVSKTAFFRRIRDYKKKNGMS